MESFQWQSCSLGAVTLSDFYYRVQQCSSISDYRQTRLSDLRLLMATTTCYLLIVFGMRAWYRGVPSNFAHKRVFVLIAALHNLFLSALSWLMNVGATYVVIQVWRESGPAATVCTPVGNGSEAIPSSFQFWMYLFFMSKFYELLDTILLILRGRPLTLLHVWHHASVMYETWGWLEFGVTVGIYGMWFNTFVHIIMYAYYAAALLKIPFPLKKSITTLQIVQFITGFLSLIPFTYLHFTGTGCSGVIGLLISAVINGSYLLLFLRFFKKTYFAETKRKPLGQVDKLVPSNKTD